MIQLQKQIIPSLLLLCLFAILFSCSDRRADEGGDKSDGEVSENTNDPIGSADVWENDRIYEWYEALPWLFGSNFIPSTAINQIEMWQRSSWDPKTIDRELSYAEKIGMNTMRVYLHYLVWKEEGSEFLKRMDAFLEMADAHKISIMFVLFDDCWDPTPYYGKQREPIPFVHNSGWVQCPGWEILSDTARHEMLKPYLQEVLSHFADDERVLAWDLYNEPGNMNQVAYNEADHKPEYSIILLEKVFKWAREINPSQPLTSAVWTGDWSDPDSLSLLNTYALDNSDFISFHCYLDLDGFIQSYMPLTRYLRPIICTEFMSRGSGGLFKTILPYMKEQSIGGYNWGLVAGKTLTIYSWESWIRNVSAEADFWHHDILRRDGTPYDIEEIELFKSFRE